MKSPKKIRMAIQAEYEKMRSKKEIKLALQSESEQSAIMSCGPRHQELHSAIAATLIWVLGDQPLAGHGKLIAASLDEGVAHIKKLKARHKEWLEAKDDGSTTTDSRGVDSGGDVPSEED